MTVAILGMGKSLKPADVDYLRGKCRVLCINETFRLAPWGDWLYAADHNWWDHYIDEVKETFQGERWTQARDGNSPRPGQEERRHAAELGINWCQFMPGIGFNAHPNGGIHGAGSSGYQGMQLACKWGAHRILLLGFDGYKGTWLNERPKKFRRESPYQSWRERYRLAASESPVPIINCSPGSAYNCFETANLRDVL